MGGEIKHNIIIPECLRRVMPPEEKALFDKLRRPVCQCKGAVCGFAGSGRDFIMSFAGWLIMNRWLTVPEAPALHVLWLDGDDAGAIKRAIKAGEYVVAEERAGRNVLVSAAETFSAEPWRAEWWRTAESVTDALTHAKSISGKSSRCAIMTTYVDDCDLDAAKPLRSLVWKVVLTQVAAKDPVQMQKFLGVVREAWNGTSSCRGLRLTQSHYTAKVLEDAVKLGLGPIRVCTTGQSGTPPDPKLLPEQPCDPGVRELIGSLLFLSRCTRFDLSFVVARLARFVTRWCEWARKEIRHILGFVACPSGWSLIMKSADDDWEELRLSTFCDASFGTRCFGGYKVKLTGSRGSSFLIEWASRLQGPQSTSSTESESIEWGRAAKAILRVKGALDACRLKPVPCDGYVDNHALRLAVQRGSSAKLGHLRVHAETCFRFLAQLPISLHRVGTAENEADIMTKVLSSVRHRELCKTDFDLDAVPEVSIMPHAAMCRHAGWRSLGSPEDVFSCPCTTAQLLGKLTDV